ncbi:MAG: CPBP family intramembrane metalloprotease [Alcaligenaceae bacterium]|nr:MAG: CPBP family intramembrane metalloprotease [Alcaligenaceae bacterium]
MHPATPLMAHELKFDFRQSAALASALVPMMGVWLLNGWYLPLLAAIDIRLFWAADILQWVVLPVALLWPLATVASIPPRCYGLCSPRFGPIELALKSAAVFATAGIAFVITRNLVWRIFGPNPGSFYIAPHFPAEWWGALARVYASVSAGLVESIFFIGIPWLLYAGNSSRPSPHRFAVAMSALFALAHWEQGCAVATGAFFSHLILCAWFLRWRTLWPVASGHALIDAVSLG